MPYKGQHTAKLPSPGVFGSFPLKNALARIGGEASLGNCADVGSLAAAAAGVDVNSPMVRYAESATTDLDITRVDGHATLEWTPADHENLIVGPDFNFDLGAGLPWVFECRIKQTTAAEHGFLAGLVSVNAAADATYDVYAADKVMNATSQLVTARSMIGFYKDEAIATVDAITKDWGTADGSETDILATAHTLVDATFVKLGIYSNGNTMRFFVDNTLKASYDMTSTGIPSDTYNGNMAPMISYNASGVTAVFIQWVAAGYLV
jgi:hypothetical protein